MTFEQIAVEAEHLPPEAMAELAERLAVKLHGDWPEEMAQAWRSETRKRVAEIMDGTEPGVSGPEVSARVRKLVGR